MSQQNDDAYHDALLRGLCAEGAEEVARAATLSHEPKPMNPAQRTVADELLAQIRATQQGDPWYGESRSAILEGITPQQAAAHPVAGAHSIWELVLHMTAWTDEVCRRLGGSEPAAPEQGDWPPVPAPTTDAWRKTLKALEQAHARLLDTASAMPIERWTQPVGTNRDAPLGTGVSIGAMLVGLAQHDAYHTGQVALLVRALE